MLASKEKAIDHKDRQDKLAEAAFYMKRYKETKDTAWFECAQFFAQWAKDITKRMEETNYEALDKKWAIYHKLKN